mgnify:CR=1 FL=1
MNQPNRYGAIDIGSNGMRLLIANVKEDNELISVQKLTLVRVPIRLGEDVFETGRISDEKREQFVKTIKAYKLLMEIYNVRDFRAVATSAMREASNGNEVADEIKKETGIDIKLIDGKIEAEEYKSMRTRYSKQINEIKDKLRRFGAQIADTKQLTQSSLNLLTNLSKSFIIADVKLKQKIVSSIFPKLICFDKNNCVSGRVTVVKS